MKQDGANKNRGNRKKKNQMKIKANRKMWGKIKKNQEKSKNGVRRNDEN